MKQKFDMGFDPRRNLRNWLEENFNYFSNTRDKKSLEEVTSEIDTIFNAVNQVLVFTETKSGPEIQKYYQWDSVFIRNTYKAHDVEKFAEAVRTFKDAINVE